MEPKVESPRRACSPRVQAPASLVPACSESGSSQPWWKACLRPLYREGNRLRGRKATPGWGPFLSCSLAPSGKGGVWSSGLSWGTPGLDGMQPRDCGLDKDGRRSQDRPQPLPLRLPPAFPLSPSSSAFLPHPLLTPCAYGGGAIQRRWAPEEWGSGHSHLPVRPLFPGPPSVCGCLEWRRERQSLEEPGWSQMGQDPAGGKRPAMRGDNTTLMARAPFRAGGWRLQDSVPQEGSGLCH